MCTRSVDRNKKKNIVNCIVCFKNKRMYNLMMADIAADNMSLLRLAM